MVIRCFGDSFVEQHIDKKDYWIYMLGEQLGCTIQNHALGGSSLGYTYVQFDNEIKNVLHSDKIGRAHV